MQMKSEQIRALRGRQRVEMISEKGRMRTSKVEGGQGGGSESENMSINNYQVQG